MKKILMTILCAMFFTFGMVLSANAFTIDAQNYFVPDEKPSPLESYYVGGGALLPWWYGWANDTPTILSTIKTIPGWDPAWEEVFKAEYEKVNDQPVNNVTINFTGGADRLLVKDGANNPAWYLFDISSWNGTDPIELENFWADRTGEISFVALFNGTKVPEPGMVILLGIGLLGLAFYNRKRLLN